jgi:hypothetical protein
MPAHSYQCLASLVWLPKDLNKIKMVEGGHCFTLLTTNKSGMKGKTILNKMTPANRSIGSEVIAFIMF